MWRLEQYTSTTIMIYTDEGRHGHLEATTNGAGYEGWRFVPWHLTKKPGRAVRPLVDALAKACKITKPEARELLEKNRRH